MGLTKHKSVPQCDARRDRHPRCSGNACEPRPLNIGGSISELKPVRRSRTSSSSAGGGGACRLGAPRRSAGRFDRPFLHAQPNETSHRALERGGRGTVPLACGKNRAINSSPCPRVRMCCRLDGPSRDGDVGAHIAGSETRREGHACSMRDAIMQPPKRAPSM